MRCAWSGWHRCRATPAPPPSWRHAHEDPAAADPDQKGPAGPGRSRLRMGGQTRPVRRHGQRGARHPRGRRPPPAGPPPAGPTGPAGRGPAATDTMSFPVDLPTLLAALLAGMLGGLHCVAMCGGIATGFHAIAAGPAGTVAWQANTGRIMGYVLAGAAAGGLGGGVLRLFRFAALAVGVRMAAGAALVLVALRLLDRGGRLDLLGRPGVQAWRWLQPVRRLLIPANRSWKRLALGALWGWMPCGLSMG